MDRKLMKKVVSDAIANANFKRLSATGKAADDARELLEELKALQDGIEKEDYGGAENDVGDIPVHVEVPFSCVPLLLEALDRAIGECDKTVDGKRKAKKLIDVQIALMGGRKDVE